MGIWWTGYGHGREPQRPVLGNVLLGKQRVTMQRSIRAALLLGAVALPVIAQDAQAQTFEPGMVVTSCSAGQDDQTVVAIEDLRRPATTGGTLGQGWNYAATNKPPIPANSEWTRGELGQVFGLALGGIDPNTGEKEIFVSNANIYREPPWGGTATTYPGGDRHGIFRLNPSGGLNNGRYEKFYSVPSQGSNANRATTSLGQIAYSLDSRTLYVSNMDDGIISAVRDNGSNALGTQIGLFDHGMNRDTIGGLPEISDNNTARLTQHGRFIWGVQVNRSENRLYYAVMESETSNSIWSVGLTPSGTFMSATIRKEFDVPASVSKGVGVSDIAFNFAGNTMMIAERGAELAGWLRYNPHTARVFHYTGSSGAWVPEVGGNQQKVGDYGSHANSAGGLDYSYGYKADESDIDTLQPEGRTLITANAMKGVTVYGIQSTSISKGFTAWNNLDHYFVDFNGVLGNPGNQEKNYVGDVESFRQPTQVVDDWECLTIEGTAECTGSSLGGPSENQITLDITHDILGSAGNNMPITDLRVTTVNGPYPGANLVPGDFGTNPVPGLPLFWGDSTSVTFPYDAAPGQQQACFLIDVNKPVGDSQSQAPWMSNNELCCSMEVCVDLTPCENCLELDGDYQISYFDARGNGTDYVGLTGTICSDALTLDNLVVEYGGQEMTIVNITPTGGNCLTFSAELREPNLIPDDGLDMPAFEFSATSEPNALGVAECCEDRLETEEYFSNDPNVTQLDGMPPYVAVYNGGGGVSMGGLARPRGTDQ